MELYLKGIFVCYLCGCSIVWLPKDSWNVASGYGIPSIGWSSFHPWNYISVDPIVGYGSYHSLRLRTYPSCSCISICPVWLFFPLINYLARRQAINYTGLLHLVTLDPGAWVHLEEGLFRPRCQRHLHRDSGATPLHLCSRLRTPLLSQRPLLFTTSPLILRIAAAPHRRKRSPFLPSGSGWIGLTRAGSHRCGPVRRTSPEFSKSLSPFFLPITSDKTLQSSWASGRLRIPGSLVYAVDVI